MSKAKAESLAKAKGVSARIVNYGQTLSAEIEAPSGYYFPDMGTSLIEVSCNNFPGMRKILWQGMIEDLECQTTDIAKDKTGEYQ